MGFLLTYSKLKLQRYKDSISNSSLKTKSITGILSLVLIGLIGKYALKDSDFHLFDKFYNAENSQVQDGEVISSSDMKTYMSFITDKFYKSQIYHDLELLIKNKYKNENFEMYLGNMGGYEFSIKKTSSALSEFEICAKDISGNTLSFSDFKYDYKGFKTLVFYDGSRSSNGHIATYNPGLSTSFKISLKMEQTDLDGYVKHLEILYFPILKSFVKLVENSGGIKQLLSQDKNVRKGFCSPNQLAMMGMQPQQILNYTGYSCFGDVVEIDNFMRLISLEKQFISNVFGSLNNLQLYLANANESKLYPYLENKKFMSNGSKFLLGENNGRKYYLQRSAYELKINIQSLNKPLDNLTCMIDNDSIVVESNGLRLFRYYNFRSDKMIELSPQCEDLLEKMNINKAKFINGLNDDISFIFSRVNLLLKIVTENETLSTSQLNALFKKS